MGIIFYTEVATRTSHWLTSLGCKVGNTVLISTANAQERFRKVNRDVKKANENRNALNYTQGRNTWEVIGF